MYVVAAYLARMACIGFPEASPVLYTRIIHYMSGHVY